MMPVETMIKKTNVNVLYGVSTVPCDTSMRERLDPLSIDSINKAIHDVIWVLQRSQSLQDWDFLGTKLISV